MDDSVSAQKQLEDFANDVLTEKNLPGLTDDARPMVVEDMVATIRQLIDRAVIEAVPEDKIDEFDALLDKPETTKEQLFAFVQDSGVDTEKVVTDTLLRFRELYLQGPGGDNS